MHRYLAPFFFVRGTHGLEKQKREESIAKLVGRFLHGPRGCIPSESVCCCLLVTQQTVISSTSDLPFNRRRNIYHRSIARSTAGWGCRVHPCTPDSVEKETIMLGTPQQLLHRRREIAAGTTGTFISRVIIPLLDVLVRTATAVFYRCCFCCVHCSASRTAAALLLLLLLLLFFT